MTDGNSHFRIDDDDDAHAAAAPVSSHATPVAFSRPPVFSVLSIELVTCLHI